MLPSEARTLLEQKSRVLLRVQGIRSPWSWVLTCLVAGFGAGLIYVSASNSVVDDWVGIAAIAVLGVLGASVMAVTNTPPRNYNALYAGSLLCIFLAMFLPPLFPAYQASVGAGLALAIVAPVPMWLLAIKLYRSRATASAVTQNRQSG